MRGLAAYGFLTGFTGWRHGNTTNAANDTNILIFRPLIRSSRRSPLSKAMPRHLPTELDQPRISFEFWRALSESSPFPPLTPIQGQAAPPPDRTGQVRERIWKNEGFYRQNKRPDFPMMPLCGRPERYSCTRWVDLEAAARKRRSFVLPPRFSKSFPAFCFFSRLRLHICFSRKSARPPCSTPPVWYDSPS